MKLSDKRVGKFMHGDQPYYLHYVRCFHKNIPSLTEVINVFVQTMAYRVANISAIVPLDEKADFKKRAFYLLRRDITFRLFCRACNSIGTDFPSAKGWLSWYLQKDRVELCFPACKSLSEEDLVQFNKIKPDTNAQEGIGGFLQALTGYQKLTLSSAIEHVVNFCLNYDRKTSFAAEGYATTYIRKKVSRAAKKKGEEPVRNYRPPDSAMALLQPKRKKEKNVSTKSGLGPELASGVMVPQMENLGSTCFMSSLIQCIWSSQLASYAIKHEMCCFPRDCVHPITPFAELLKRMDNEVEVLKPKELLECAQRCNLLANTQHDPGEFLTKMLEILNDVQGTSETCEQMNVNLLQKHYCSGENCLDI